MGCQAHFLLRNRRRLSPHSRGSLGLAVTWLGDPRPPSRRPALERRLWNVPERREVGAARGKRGGAGDDRRPSHASPGRSGAPVGGSHALRAGRGSELWRPRRRARLRLLSPASRLAGPAPQDLRFASPGHAAPGHGPAGALPGALLLPGASSPGWVLRLESGLIPDSGLQRRLCLLLPEQHCQGELGVARAPGNGPRAVLPGVTASGEAGGCLWWGQVAGAVLGRARCSLVVALSPASGGRPWSARGKAGQPPPPACASGPAPRTAARTR